MKTIHVYLIAWTGLLVVAILNGTLRVAGYSRYMSDLSAHQLSTAIGITLFAVYMYVLAGYFPLASARQAWMIGALWLLLTICFEFIFGHYVMDNSWSKLFADYNLLKGRLWVLVLIWTLIGPYLMYRIRR